MGSYRIEESPNKRAGCSVKACKDQKVKIQKGEIRLGVWVDTERFQSWSWRHWGCLTPKVLHNIRESIDGDNGPNFELLDGFEELPADAQAKVKKALEDGEIAEADRTFAPAEAAGEDASDRVEESPVKTKTTVKSKSKKRARAESEEAEHEATTKSRKAAKGKRAVTEKEPEDDHPTKRAKVVRKATKDSTKEPEETSKQKRGRKTKADTVDNEVEIAKSEEKLESELPAKKSRGKKASANNEKSKRSRPKRKAPGNDDE